MVPLSVPCAEASFRSTDESYGKMYPALHLKDSGLGCRISWGVGNTGHLAHTVVSSNTSLPVHGL